MTDPAAMSIVDMLGAPEEIGDPADIALGQRELEGRESLPECRPDQIDKGVHRSGRGQGHRNASWRIR